MLIPFESQIDYMQYSLENQLMRNYYIILVSCSIWLDRNELASMEQMHNWIHDNIKGL